MPLQVPNLVAVLMARFAVLNAEMQRIGSVRDIHADVKMPDCHHCKKEQAKVGQQARTITRLPIEVTQNRAFKHKTMPVQLCSFCDGEALTLALLTYKKRASKKRGSEK